MRAGSCELLPNPGPGEGAGSDPEQVAQQLCPAWPCQLAHPLGQAGRPKGSLLGCKVKRPNREGTSYWVKQQ